MQQRISKLNIKNLLDSYNIEYVMKYHDLVREERLF